VVLAIVLNTLTKDDKNGFINSTFMSTPIKIRDEGYGLFKIRNLFVN
jgi:hypothetical protein